MQLSVVNFGGFKGAHLLDFQTMSKENGEGKTTRINAFVFALTGKTFSGFVPVNKDINKGESTAVTLHNFLGLPPLRRTILNGATNFYFGEGVCTQKDFEEALRNKNYDMDFIITCANANVLTSDSLDTELLRKVLSRADVIDNGEYLALKKKATDLRQKLKVAEQYALTVVTVPPQQCEPLTLAEQKFKEGFIEANRIVNEGVQSCCPACKRAYDEASINELNKRFIDAENIVERDRTEVTRIIAKELDYDLELQKIADTERLVKAAAKAREDVDIIKTQLNEVNEEIKAVDAKEIGNVLPSGVDVVTEIPMKNGNIKSTCSLSYLGIPLKSVNHAKRIEICVDILDLARTRKGMQDVPIIVDNAEAVHHNFEHVKNIILFAAKKLR